MDNQWSDRSREKAEHQERDSFFNGFKRAVLDPIRRIQGGHFVYVLGRLFFDDINNVIDGHYTDKSVFGIHDRDGNEVVMRDIAGHDFLVCFWVDGYQIFGHDIFELSIRAREKKLSQRDDPHQSILFIYGVEIECGFHVSLKLHGCYGIGNIGVVVQGIKVRGHDPAGCFLLVMEKLFDIF